MQAGRVPLDHRALIAGLERAERDDLLRRSDRLGLAQLAWHAASIATVGTLIAWRVPFWPLLLVPQGILIVFLFTALHECSHRTAFRTEWVSRAVAAVAGFLVLVPPEWFRCFHAAHHRFTHDPARDPELATPEPRTWRQYLTHLSGLPLWWASLKVLAGNAVRPNADVYVPAASRSQVMREARLFLALYGCLLLGSLLARSELLLWAWMVPILLGQPFLRGYLMAEHGRCPHVADMLANSRTTFTTGLVRRLAWNMPYHAEHHAYPAVPFHALPRFHALARAHLKTTERGYGRFHRRFAAELVADGATLS